MADESNQSADERIKELKFFKRYDPEKEFRKGQFAKAVLIWSTAGAITSQGDSGFDQTAVGATAASLAPY